VPGMGNDRLPVEQGMIVLVSVALLFISQYRCCLKRPLGWVIPWPLVDDVPLPAALTGGRHARTCSVPPLREGLPSVLGSGVPFAGLAR